MSAHRFLARFRGDQHGGAAEFALLLPIMMLFLIGIIDAGRYAYSFNRGEKASQVGARMAVVTNPLFAELSTYTFSGKTVGGVMLGQGDVVPAAALGKITCTSTACTCTTTPCLDKAAGGTFTRDAKAIAAFSALAARIKFMWPEIQDTDISVEYTGSGLGYAGNPTGMDIAPFVTVRILNRTFTSYLFLGRTVNFPDFSYTLTMEDGTGSVSN